MLAVDVRDDRPGTAAFYEQYGFEIPNVFDTREVAVSQYRVAGTPTTYLVDDAGRIVWRRYGFVAGEEVKLRQMVEALLASSRE